MIMPNSKLSFTSPNHLRILVSCVILLLISACGGGSNTSDTSPVTYTSVLTGANEVQAVVSTGTGTGTATLNTSTRVLSGSVQLTNLTATFAHIHQGASGTNGSVIVTLTDQGNGTWAVPASTVLTEAQAAAFTTNGLYFNVHTLANPNGEIRGQIPSVAITPPVTPPVTPLPVIPPVSVY